MALLCVAVRYVVWRDPKAGPAGERSSWRERFTALKGIWGVALLFLVSIGGIYAGIFTATEGAGIGAFGAFLFALFRRALTWRVAARHPARVRAHDEHAVHDPDRRADLRQLHQLSRRMPDRPDELRRRGSACIR